MMDLTDDALRELCDKDSEAFQNLLHCNLDQPQVVAACLRAVSPRPFQDFGISWLRLGESNASVKRVRRNARWDRLLKCLRTAQRDDAMCIMEAMARSIGCREREAAGEVIKVALSCPSWRLDAIRAFPALFLAGREPATVLREDRDMSRTRETYNAFYLLATLIDESKDDGYDSTLQVLQALESIGVASFRAEVSQRSMLELAATRRGNVEVVRAFVDFFPEDLNRQNFRGYAPLHSAAIQSMADNMKVLLDAGADPYLRGIHHESVLACAIASSGLDAVKLMLGVVKYDNKEMEFALAWGWAEALNLNCKVNEDGVKALLASAQAQSAIEAVHDQALEQLRPL